MPDYLQAGTRRVVPIVSFGKGTGGLNIARRRNLEGRIGGALVAKQIQRPGDRSRKPHD